MIWGLSMNKICFALYMALVAIALSLNNAHAQVAGQGLTLSVSEIQKYFLPGQSPIQNLRVSNNGEFPFLVRTKIERFVEKGEDGVWKMEPSGDILVAPKSFVLQPGVRRKVRLVLNKAIDDKEHLYRLSFSPTEYKTEAPWEDANAQGVAVGAKVVRTSGVILNVSPAQISEDLTWERDASGITFTNNGNSQIQLRQRMEWCSAGSCIRLPSENLLPGEIWRFAVDGSMPIEWATSIYGRTPYGKLEIAPVR